MIRSINYNEIEALHAAVDLSRFIVNTKPLIQQIKTHIPENADKTVFFGINTIYYNGEKSFEDRRMLAMVEQ